MMAFISYSLELCKFLSHYLSFISDAKKNYPLFLSKLTETSSALFPHRIIPLSQESFIEIGNGEYERERSCYLWRGGITAKQVKLVTAKMPYKLLNVLEETKEIWPDA